MIASTLSGISQVILHQFLICKLQNLGEVYYHIIKVLFSHLAVHIENVNLEKLRKILQQHNAQKKPFFQDI